MGVWEIVGTVAGGWSLVSVLVGVVVGHAISGKSLRTGMTPAESVMGSAVDAAFAGASVPVTRFTVAFSGDNATLDAAV